LLFCTYHNVGLVILHIL